MLGFEYTHLLRHCQYLVNLVADKQNDLLAQEVYSMNYLGIMSTSLVGVRGLEPPTSASQTLRATQLRYTPPTRV